jgi:hypothetical protein
MMNNRLQEHDSETATLKQEISTMIIQQQNNHTADMQELYDRMMQQMANMFSLPAQSFIYQTQIISYLRRQLKTPANSNGPHIADPPEHLFKKQDTRPSPIKRKTSNSAITPETHTIRAAQHTDQSSLMETDKCESPPPIEDDV